MSDGTRELAAAVQTMLEIAPKFPVKARWHNVLCHCFVLQIAVIIKHASVLLIRFRYRSLPSFSLINGCSNVIWGLATLSAKEMVFVECTHSADFSGVV